MQDFRFRKEWWQYYKTLPRAARETFIEDVCRFAFDGDKTGLKPYLAEIYDELADTEKKIDFDKLLTFFNATCAGMPNVRTMTKKRRGAVLARVSEHGKAAIYEVIQKAAVAPFLNGANTYGWKASFDWLFAPTNFVKVLEGNYDKAEKIAPAGSFKSTI